MRRFTKSANYHLRRILFQKYGVPNVRDEKISKAVLKKYLPKDPVIIDCGAHDGTDTMELAGLFRMGTVHAFEPVEQLFSRLKQRKPLYNNTYYYKVALADKNGFMNFYVSEGNSDASSSLLQPNTHLMDHPDTTFHNTISVKTLTLDDWAHQYSISKIDMLWLDMQGYEMQMLMASKRVLNTVSVIHTEVSTKETYKGVATYSVYRKFLEDIGFKVVLEAIPRGWDMGNVLFVR